MISFPDLIKKIADLYSKNFFVIFTIILLSLVWNIILGLLPQNFNAALRVSIVSVSLIISTFTELALVGGLALMIKKEKIKITQIFKTALNKLPYFIFLIILWGIIIFAGALFLIVPGVIFATWFMFISPIVVIENAKGLSVFKISKALVDGYFFPLLLRAAGMLVLLFFTVAMATAGFNVMMSWLPIASSNAIASLFGGILSTFATPIISAAIVTLYFEMKRIKG